MVERRRRMLSYMILWLNQENDSQAGGVAQQKNLPALTVRGYNRYSGLRGDLTGGFEGCFFLSCCSLSLMSGIRVAHSIHRSL